MITDRSPALIGSGEPGPIAGEAQLKSTVPMYSWLDPHMELNRSSATGFPYGNDQENPTGECPWGWMETVSGSSPTLRIEPADVAFTTQRSAGTFFSWSIADLGSAMAIGVSTVNRSRGLAPQRAAGSSQTPSLTLGALAGRFHSPAPFQLELAGEPELTDAMHRFASVFNMFQGFVLGNSPVSVTCLHEMEYFPKLQGLYAPASEAEAFSVHDAIGKQIEFFAARGVGSDGLPYPRWDIRGFEACNPAGGSGEPPLPAQPQPESATRNDTCFSNRFNIMDQVPHFLVAVYWHVVNTGDRAFLERVWPAVLKVERFMLSSDGMQMQERGFCINPIPGSGTPDSCLHAAPAPEPADPNTPPPPCTVNCECHTTCICRPTL